MYIGRTKYKSALINLNHGQINDEEEHGQEHEEKVDARSNCQESQGICRCAAFRRRIEQNLQGLYHQQQGLLLDTVLCILLPQSSCENHIVERAICKAVREQGNELPQRHDCH